LLGKIKELEGIEYGILAGEYDVAVVGAGHAGCEAALAAARLGVKTVVFAINLDSMPTCLAIRT